MDVAHSYQYSFEPNKSWSNFYATSGEIRAYLQSVCDKYSVGRFVKLSHRVDNIKYDPQDGIWYVSLHL